MLLFTLRSYECCYTATAFVDMMLIRIFTDSPSPHPLSPGDEEGLLWATMEGKKVLAATKRKEQERKQSFETGRDKAKWTREGTSSRYNHGRGKRGEGKKK